MSVHQRQKNHGNSVAQDSNKMYLHQKKSVEIENPSPGAESCPDRILKNFIHPKECEDAPSTQGIITSGDYNIY